MTAANHASLVSVVSNNRCIGFLFARGPTGIEAYTHDEKSLGTFANEREAIAAILKPTPQPARGAGAS